MRAFLLALVVPLALTGCISIEKRSPPKTVVVTPPPPGQAPTVICPEGAASC